MAVGRGPELGKAIKSASCQATTAVITIIASCQVSKEVRSPPWPRRWLTAGSGGGDRGGARQCAAAGASCYESVMSEDKVIDYLRGRFARIDERFDAVDRKLDELVQRVGKLERQVAELHVDNAIIHQRLDNLAQRVSRIERRLELSGEPAAG